MTPDNGNTGTDQEDPESQLKNKRARLEESTPENKVSKSNDQLFGNLPMHEQSTEIRDIEKAKSVSSIANPEEMSEFSFNGGASQIQN